MLTTDCLYSVSPGLLLDKSASPHACAKNGYTPLHISAKKNQMEIAKASAKEHLGESLHYLAVIAGPEFESLAAEVNEGANSRPSILPNGTVQGCQRCA